jgi:glycosyltransferase involved in cell wall biosynthesis
MNKQPSIALVPDHFAHYRYPVFRLLSNEANNYSITIYADIKAGRRGVKIVSDAFCNDELSRGGIRWRRVRDRYYRGVCFWQTGLVKMALGSDHDIFVYWGEAHRLSTWVSAIISRLRGKKVLFWTHGLYGKESAFKRYVRIIFYRIGNGLLLYGDHAKKLLRPVMDDECEIRVINNSLDCASQIKILDGLSNEQLADLKAKYFNLDDRVICFVGRLQSIKRLDVLVRALYLLKSEYNIMLKLLIIGDGDEKDNLQRLTDSLGLSDAVVYFGECYDDEKILPLLSMSDILVSPGDVGLTAMHALVSGIPVITHGDLNHQMPEAEAIEYGVNGCFFKRNNVDDLANKIIECLEMLSTGRISPKTCRSTVESRYNPEYQLEVFSEIVLSICGI